MSSRVWAMDFDYKLGIDVGLEFQVVDVLSQIVLYDVRIDQKLAEMMSQSGIVLCHIKEGLGQIIKCLWILSKVFDVKYGLLIWQVVLLEI